MGGKSPWRHAIWWISEWPSAKARTGGAVVVSWPGIDDPWLVAGVRVSIHLGDEIAVVDAVLAFVQRDESH